MKHTGSYIIAAIWILIAVFLSGVLVHEMKGSNSGWSIFSLGGFVNGNFSPVDTETIETDYSEDSVKGVNVDLVSASFRMSVGSGSRIVVKITTNLPEDRRPVAKMDGSTLVVKAPKNVMNNFNFGLYKTTVEITVPSSFNTSSRATSRDIKIDNVSGSIQVEKITANSFDIDVVSGSIKLTDINADSVDTDSVSGSTNIEGKFSKFDVDSVSGSVNVRTSDMVDSKSSVNTVSGSVHIYIPENNGFTLDYSSVSGTTRNEFTGFKSDSKTKSGKNEYKNGGVKISAETISGSIHVEKN